MWPTSRRKRVGGAMRDDDRHAFGAVFEAHFPRLTAYAYRYLKTLDAAEDVVHEVFASLWCLDRRLDEIRDLSAYLSRAVRNRTLNQLRRRRAEEHHRLLAWSLVERGEPASAALELDELARAIEMAIDALPSRTREVFLLSREQGLTYREIAEFLGISVKTVETLMGRALRAMRRRVGAAEPGRSPARVAAANPEPPQRPGGEAGSTDSPGPVIVRARRARPS